MKTIKAKIIALIIILTVLLCGILGVLNVILNTSTAMNVLEKNMVETVKLASSRIEKELEITKQVAIDTGCISRLSDPFIALKNKKETIDERVKANGYLGGNLIDTNGIIQDGSVTSVKDRDYFISAMKGEAFISGPLVSKTTGVYSVIIAAPVWKGGKQGTEVAGVVYYKPDVNMFSGIVSTINIGQTGGAYLIDKTGLVMAHSDESLVFQLNANEAAKEDSSFSRIAEIEQNMIAGSTGYDSYQKDGATWVQAYAPIAGTDGWSVGVYVREDEFLGSVQTAIMLTGCVSIFFIIAGMVVSIIFTKKVLKPIGIAAMNLQKMANGEVLDTLDESKFKGEFLPIARSFNEVSASLYRLLDDTGMLTKAALEGELSVRADASNHKGGYRDIIEGVNKTLDAVIQPVDEATEILEELSKGNLNVFVKGDYKGDHAVVKNALNETIISLKGYISEISGVLSGIADGNLALGINSEFKGDFMALKDSINSIVNSLNNVLSEINVAAEQVNSGTRQVSEGSQEISQGATEQASAIEELTASVTQIAEQTRQNAISANKANELTLSAKDVATKGNEQMKAMQQAMAEINEASENISKIIKVIDDIAFQTNILALNAAVEAARAGIHGKGFAVVAEEVRNLAARSANAAKQTTDLIEGSIKKAEVGTKIADETARALASIVKGVDTAAQLVGEIAAASNEQASGITQVNNGIEQMSQVVQTNSATSEEAAASAEELSSQAEMLKSMVGRFKLNTNVSVNANVSIERKDMPEKPAKSYIALSDSEFGKY